MILAIANRILWAWHAHRRAIDMDILWPACLAHAEDLDHAKAAFAVHAYNDGAWLSLGEDGLRSAIDALR
jgi:hypothetical protein